MKILITGGTGRVGANLAQALLDKGHEIRSFVYPGDQSRAHKLDGFDRVETIEGDLRNFADVRRAVEGVDAVYHIAAAFAGPFDNRDWSEAVPYLAERFGLGYVDARRPDWNYFELDLTNIKQKLGFEPKHDLASILDAAEAMRRGEDVGIIPTGVRFG